MIEKNLTDTNTRVDELLEQLLDRQNLNAAYVQVVGNGGAGGIDKIGVESLVDYLREHKEKLLTATVPDLLKGWLNRAVTRCFKMSSPKSLKPIELYTFSKRS